MQLVTINNNPMGQNVYLYFDPVKKEGVIIDPGHNANEILAETDKHDIAIKGILLTHGHFDHITAVGDINAHLQAEICCHTEEKSMLEDSELNLSTRTGNIVEISPTRLLNCGDTFSFANTTLEIIHTPGHTPGCVCYYDKENAVIFTGDTLFKMSVGRTDLPAGCRDTLMDGIKNKLFVLPGNVVVYPGHGGKTTIEQEKKSNPFVR